MMKSSGKCLSFLLSLTMVFTGMPMSMYSFAGEAGTPQVETVAVAETQLPEALESELQEPAQEPVEEAAAETAAEETAVPVMSTIDLEDMLQDIVSVNVPGESTAVEEPAADNEESEFQPEEQENKEDASLEEMKAAWEKLFKEMQAKKAMTEFNESQVVDDVLVSVYAPAGVFPAGSYLTVKKVTASEEVAAVNEAVEEVANEDAEEVVTYTFDITVYDQDGNEIQPNTAYGEVQVAFELAEAEDEELNVDVYHVSESEEAGALVAEPVDAVAVDGEVVANAPSFSYYVVQFTIDKKNYKISNFDAIPLYGLLEYALECDEEEAKYICDGCTDLDEDVLSSNDRVFYVAEDDETEEIMIYPVSKGTATLTVRDYTNYDEENDLDYTEIKINVTVTVGSDFTAELPTESAIDLEMLMQLTELGELVEIGEYTGKYDYGISADVPLDLEDIVILPTLLDLLENPDEEFIEDPELYMKNHPELLDVFTAIKNLSEALYGLTFEYDTDRYRILCNTDELEYPNSYDTYEDFEEALSYQVVADKLWLPEPYYESPEYYYERYEQPYAVQSESFDGMLPIALPFESQIAPFAAIIASDEEPVIKVQCNTYDLPELMPVIVENQYYLVPTMAELYDLPYDHNLLNPIEKNLRVVYGYAIFDSSFNVGYKILGYSNDFHFSLSGISVSNTEPYFEIYAGDTVDLLSGITATNAAGEPLEVKIENIDEIDFNLYARDDLKALQTAIEEDYGIAYGLPEPIVFEDYYYNEEYQEFAVDKLREFADDYDINVVLPSSISEISFQQMNLGQLYPMFGIDYAINADYYTQRIIYSVTDPTGGTSGSSITTHFEGTLKVAKKYNDFSSLLTMLTPMMGSSPMESMELLVMADIMMNKGQPMYTFDASNRESLPGTNLESLEESMSEFGEEGIRILLLSKIFSKIAIAANDAHAVAAFNNKKPLSMMGGMMYAPAPLLEALNPVISNLQLFTESKNLIKELKSHFYRWNGYEYEKIPASWVELVDDGGYEYPYEWEDIEEPSAMFMLTFEISDPESDEEPVSYPMLLNIGRTSYEFDIFTLFMDGGLDPSGLSGGTVEYITGVEDEEELEDAKRFSHSPNLSAVAGDTSFWLYQLIQLLNGSYTINSENEIVAEGSPIGDNGALFMVKYASKIGTFEGMFPLEDYANMQLELDWDALPESIADLMPYISLMLQSMLGSMMGEEGFSMPALPGDIQLQVSGSIDIYTEGVYEVDITPVIDGVVKEELTMPFVVTVGEEPPKTVTINGAADKAIYKKVTGEGVEPYTKAELEDIILSGVSARTEKNEEAKLKYAIKTLSGETVTMDQLINGAFPEGTELMLIYSGQHPKTDDDGNPIVTTAEVVLTILYTDILWTGVEPAEIGADFVYDAEAFVKEGITAETEAGDSVEVTLVDTDFTDDVLDVPGTYYATYSAIHPQTGATYTVTKEIEVAETTADTVLTIVTNEHDYSWYLTDFYLGTAAAKRIAVKGNCDVRTGFRLNEEDNYSLEFTFPYGFEPVSNPKLMGIAPKVSGSYKDEGGTTVSYNQLDGDGFDFTFTLVPHLEILYPAFVREGYGDEENPYEIKGLVRKDGVITGDNGGAIKTFSANDTAASDFTVLTMEKEEWNPSELFGFREGTKLYGGAVYSDSGLVLTDKKDNVESYDICIEKPLGELPDPDWSFAFKIPEGLRIRTDIPCAMIFCSGENYIGEMKGVTPTTASELGEGWLKVPLYTSDRYTYNEVYDSSEYGSMTYMDLARQADTIILSMFFAPDMAKADQLKINLPDNPNGKNQGAMTGSKVLLFNGGTTYSAISENEISITLFNNTAESALEAITSMQDYYYVWTNSNSELTLQAGAKSKEVSGFAADEEDDSCKWNIYRGLTIETTYANEYSPVGVESLDNNKFDLFYTVSNGSGEVAAKKDLKYEGSFNLSSGEYVSKLKLVAKGDYSLMWRNWSYTVEEIESTGDHYDPYHYSMKSYPVIICQAKNLSSNKVLTLSTTAYDEFYDLGTYDRTVTIEAATEDNYQIYAENYASSSYQIVVGETTQWQSYNGLEISLGSNAKTMQYTNPRLVVVGDALAMADLSNIYTRYGETSIVGYSTSPEVTTAGPNNAAEKSLWITDPKKVAALTSDYLNFDNPVTGLLLDISKTAYAGSASTETDWFPTNYIVLYSQYFWNTTPAFEKVVKPMILSDGYAYLTYSVGFYADGGKHGEVSDRPGSTAKVTAGRVPASLYQFNTNETINPLAGDLEYYDIDEMELVRIGVNSSGDDTYYGSDKATTVFESDGTEEGDALMSLAEGLMIRSYDYWAGYGADATVNYTVKKTDGSTVTRSAKKLYNYSSNHFIYEIDNDASHNYGYFYPFELGYNEYVTNVTVSWSFYSGRRELYPEVSLVRTSMIPETTLTGYDLTSGEQLSTTVRMTYSGWTGSNTELTLAAISAKIGSFTEVKHIDEYTAKATYRGEGGSAAASKGDTVAVELNQVFSFVPEEARMGAVENGISSYVYNRNGDANYNKLRPTVYYRVAKGFTYVSGSLTGANAVANYKAKQFGDDGLLTVTYNGYYASSQAAVTASFRLGYDMATGAAIAPITDVWFDDSYDLQNGLSERNYGIAYGAGAELASLPAVIAGDMHSVLHATLSGETIGVNDANLDRFDCVPTLQKEDGTVNGSASEPMISTADHTFGVYADIVADHSATAAEQWYVYIPLPRKGMKAATNFSEEGGYTYSAESDFDLLLSAEPDFTLNEGSNVKYTTSTMPSVITYENMKALDDSFVTATAVSDWNDVTAIRIYISSISKGHPGSFSFEFEPAVKTETGTQHAYLSCIYNYKNGDGTFLTRTSRCNEFVLDDFYISGSIWEDANRDGAMNDYSSLSGATIRATDNDTSKTYEGIVYDDGSYTIAVPATGDYYITMTKDFYDPDDYSHAMDLTTKDAAGSNLTTKSWLDPATGRSDLITIGEESATVSGISISLLGTTLPNVNIGMTEINLSANDFSFGVGKNVVLTEEAALSLAKAEYTARPGGTATLCVDPEDLAAIQADITACKESMHYLSIYMHTDDEEGMALSTTVTVYLRGQGSSYTPAEPGSEDPGEEYITASDFSFAVGEDAELTASTARKQAFVSAKDSEGNDYRASKIKVNAEQLEAINAALLNEANVGKKYPLTFSTSGLNGATVKSVTVQVTLTDTDKHTGKIATNYETATNYLTGKDFSYPIKNGTMTAIDFANFLLTEAGITAKDRYGYAIELTYENVNEADILKVCQAIEDKTPKAIKVSVSTADDPANPETWDKTIKITVTITDDFVVAFGGNGATKGKIASQTVNYGGELTIPESPFEREGYKFLGYSKSQYDVAPTYQPGQVLDSVAVNKMYGEVKNRADKTFNIYAVWERLPGTGVLNVSITQSAMYQEYITDTQRMKVVLSYNDGFETTELGRYEGNLVPGELYTCSFGALYDDNYTLLVEVGDYSEERSVTVKDKRADASFLIEAGAMEYKVNAEKAGTEVNSQMSEVENTPESAAEAEAVALGSLGVKYEMIAEAVDVMSDFIKAGASEETSPQAITPDDPDLTEGQKLVLTVSDAGLELPMVLDITIKKTVTTLVDGIPSMITPPAVTTIAETGAPQMISIRYNAPEAYAVPKVFRVHEGNVQQFILDLNGAVQADGHYTYRADGALTGVIELWADKYSLYGIAFEGGHDPEDDDDVVIHHTKKSPVAAVTEAAVTAPAVDLPTDIAEAVRAALAAATGCPQDGSCNIAPYDIDSDPKCWYHEGVHFCIDAGLMTGYNAQQFGPMDGLTRGQLVTILYRLEGSPSSNYQLAFNDVVAGSYYEQAVRWATENHVVLGIYWDQFRPNQVISREQMATMLYRYAQYKGLDISTGYGIDLTRFKDEVDIHSYAYQAMQWTCGEGITNGRTAATIQPRLDITRAEVATMFERLCKSIFADF